MLADRPYMRGSSHELRWSMTAILLAVNVAAFVIQRILEFYTRFPVDPLFALSLQGLTHGFIWQLITFQFMHGGWLHLLVNCWAIYMFGRELELVMGERRYLTTYFGSGIAGGLLQVLLAWVWPERYGGAVVGASAGAMGLIAAFSVMDPKRKLMVLLFFVLPLRIRSKSLLLFCLLLTALGLAFPNSFFGGHIAHAAHLGGILVGCISAWLMVRTPPPRRLQITTANT